MKVRITRSDKSTWYADKIGEVFEVYPSASSEECFQVTGRIGAWFINKKNCEVIEELKFPTIEQDGEYQQLATEIGALVDTKQAQYGDAITKVGDVLAIMYPDGIKPEQYVGMGLTVRVLDKLMRVANGDQGEESAWRDVCGYGLLGEMQSNKKEDPAT